MGSVGVVAMMSEGVVLAYYAQDRLAGSVVPSCPCCRHCRHLGLAHVIQLSLGEIKLLRIYCQAALRQCA